MIQNKPGRMLNNCQDMLLLSKNQLHEHTETTRTHSEFTKHPIGVNNIDMAICTIKYSTQYNNTYFPSQTATI